MKDQDRTIEKLVTIEKAINEMLELRKQVIEIERIGNPAPAVD